MAWSTRLLRLLLRAYPRAFRERFGADLEADFAELLATLLHWDKFSVGTTPFAVWFASYLLPPPILTACMLWQRRTEVRRPPSHALPPSLRATMGTAGALVAAFAVLAVPFVLLPWAIGRLVRWDTTWSPRNRGSRWVASAPDPQPSDRPWQPSAPRRTWPLGRRAARVAFRLGLVLVLVTVGRAPW